jgi:cardiolipin synthase
LSKRRSERRTSGRLHAIRHGSPTLPDGGGFHLFTEGDELYADMVSAITTARESVRLECYIFADDEIGNWFASVLGECAGRGIAVQVHLDAAGSLFWGPRQFIRRMANAGVQVRWYHRWSWRRPMRYNRRLHRKLLVVDRRRAYVGGFNIHRESSRRIVGETRWRDTHVAIDGPLAAEAADLFDTLWARRKYDAASDEEAATSMLVSNRSRADRRDLHGVYADAFDSALDRVYLTTPYFVPDRKTQRHLTASAGRGVDVRLLVPAKSDVPIARWAARAAYAGLLNGGVRIYEYLPRMLHAKTVVLDGAWGTVGTANLDYRSFFLNQELTLVTGDSNLCRCLEEQFLEDLEEAAEIPADAWPRRRWPERLLEMVGWLAPWSSRLLVRTNSLNVVPA